MTQYRHSFCQHRVSLVETRRINYNLTLKGHFEYLIYSQGHDMIGKGHVAFQSILIVGLNTSIIYGVFIALAGLYQKLLPKKLLMTFRGLKLPWRHGEGSLVAIF